MKQGDVVLIWGASADSALRNPVALNGGAMPVCVVTARGQGRDLRSMGADLLSTARRGLQFWKDENSSTPEWKRFGKKIRELTGGDDIDIVFEHPGRETFGASVYVTKRGGTTSPAPRPRAICTSTTTATSG